MQIEVEWSSPELSMMDKGQNQQSVEIWPKPFHHCDPLNYQLDNAGII